MQRVAGILGGFNLWEMVIIPSLLNNAETWVEITEASLQTLEELQNMFLGKLLRTKCTTPKEALTFETGIPPMKT